MRRLPRAGADVLTTLPNGAELEAIVGPSPWIRVGTEPVGWAHTSGLRCTERQEG